MASKYFLLIFLLLIPLALAETTFKVDQTTDVIKITGTCSNANLPVGLAAQEDLFTVWFDEVKSGSDKTFSADFLGSKTVPYSIRVACSGDKPVTTASKPGTVGSSGGDDPSTDTPPNNNGGYTSSNCNPSWSCSVWSHCDNTLAKTRTCYDSNNCNKDYKKPNVTQSCSSCDVSWTCSDVRYCDDGSTYCNAFIDEHSCGSYVGKPMVKASCPDKSVGYVAPPAYTPPPVKPVVQQPAPVQQSFFDQYGLWLIIGISVFLLIIIIIIVVVHMRKPEEPEPGI
jgi:hypothetical protein